ncbi:hypothetical protein EHI48_00880 [Rhizobium sp. WSM1325]|nr:hypothetical protein EHI43_26640 [Rhizobium leguminosarum]RWY82758.1 hypothetical protein EHI48_00880 [Rhizobium leguminosarum]
MDAWQRRAIRSPAGEEIRPLPFRRRRELRPIGLPNKRAWMDLQRRASFQTRKGRCNTLNCRIIFSLNRFRFEELCRRSAAGHDA